MSLSPLGLVEMTRKRTRESLEHLLCEPCPACEGRGFVKTPETVSQRDVSREIMRQSRHLASRELLILAHQDVVDHLLENEAATLAELKAQVGRPIRMQVEALYGVDQFDVVQAEHELSPPLRATPYAPIVPSHAPVAAIQMTSGPDVPANLQERVRCSTRPRRGARLRCCPRTSPSWGLRWRQAWRGRRGRSRAHPGLSRGERATASLWIVAGTVPLRGAADGRVAAASLVYDANGERGARYDKIHLFDVEIPERESYRESATWRRERGDRRRNAGGAARPFRVL